jgi:hypothetical protein
MSDDRVICRRCARDFKRRPGYANRDTVPGHKCPHGQRCLEVYDPAHCTLCRAVLEAEREILEPTCVFCSTVPRKIDCYTPSFGRGGCEACGIPGGGQAGRSRHVDRALLDEVRAGMVDVWKVGT